MNVLTATAAEVWLPALLVVAGGWGWALWRAPWRALLEVPARQHAAYAALLFLALFWLLNVEVREVLILHPLLVTALVMIFGGELALIIGNLALLLGWVIEPRPWSALPLDSLLSITVPVLTTLLVLRLIERQPSANLFVYMLGGGFFGAMLSILAMGLTAWCMFALGGMTAQLTLLEDNYLLIVLLMFPEGFINGTVVTMLAVFRPDLLKTYDDRRYLG